MAKKKAAKKKATKKTPAKAPKRKERPSLPWIVDTIRLVADFFEVSETAVQKWIRAGMPRHAGERRREWWYDLREIRIWKELQEQETAEKRRGQSKGVPDEDAALEREKKKIDLQHRRLKYQIDAGKVVMREPAKAKMAQMCNMIRGRLDAIPEELGSSLPIGIRADFVADARHKIRLLQLEIAKWGG